MPTTLLEQVREISRSMQESLGQEVDFFTIAELLGGVLNCNVYILARKGSIVAYSLSKSFLCPVMEETVLKKGVFPSDFAQRLKRVDTTTVLGPNEEFSRLEDATPWSLEKESLMVLPLFGGGERLGTLLFSSPKREFLDEDTILAEIGATLVGMEIVRDRSEKAEDTVRKKAACQIALGTLSYSEQRGLERMIEDLGGQEGPIVISRMADEAGITRSVIVRVLRKLESAGILESRSLGVKGTYLRVVNEFFLEELAKHSRR